MASSCALLVAFGATTAAAPAKSRPRRWAGAPRRRLGLSAPRRSRGGALRARSGDERARMSHGEGSLGFGSGGEVGKWEEEMEKEKKRKKGWVHFVGIGGSGVSALAMLALEQGFEVSGSDIKWSSFMDQLQRAGARLFIGHSIASFEGLTVSAQPDAVVISSAIPKDNVEILHAKSVGIPIYKRDGWLKMITDKYNLIAVSGTHGKSTTAAMLSYVLDSMGDNPIAVVGANVPQFSGGNIISGSGPNFVLEADEYDSCFLGLSPYIAVVTNVEWDHVDIFPDEGDVENIFRQFVHRIRTGGHLILCGDSPGACKLLSESANDVVSNRSTGSSSAVLNHSYSTTTYGLSDNNDWCASSITPNSQGGQRYVLHYRGRKIANIDLLLPGVHNVLNSLAVIASVAALHKDRNSLDSTIDSVRIHLSTFKGVSRRFELLGTVNGCQIYDDYAHHPTEVRAVLQAARQKFPSQALWVVFQAHTFSIADHVIVSEIYGGRETNKWNADARDLSALISGPSAEYIPKMDDVLDKLVLKILSEKNQETVILIIGSTGDIVTLGPKLLRALQGKS
ncbi:uncharacterized protein LOC109728601 isoform X2 [Ananas comosus]|uniref:UDP-N-acetylmuramate--L-alanine ligase n=1 Tax=Ananas comosus TaxID=4615 RepID=A0A6P5H405_ANACO|nr:uncharacterized protein LOC109728601 isoform X2 [Ananas comosus]